MGALVALVVVIIIIIIIIIRHSWFPHRTVWAKVIDYGHIIWTCLGMDRSLSEVNKYGTAITFTRIVLGTFVLVFAVTVSNSCHFDTAIFISLDCNDHLIIICRI